MPGKGQLVLTGQLGGVMKESAQAALSFVRSRARSLGIAPDFFEKIDVHIHVPAGAIPKDGPSAGNAILAAMVSLFTSRRVRGDVAMTGEITLRGNVLPVGGIKEKVLAAHRAGIKRVVLPERNRKDLVDVPPEVQRDLEFLFVRRVEEVIAQALEEPTADLGFLPVTPAAPPAPPT
jgi:ATP-dependent Lon protease